MAVCNICGGAEFVPGPNDRLAETGAPPRCSGCFSLERHRSVRECFSRFPAELLGWRRAIQFAPDRSLDPGWFRSYEESQYEGENSIDLQEVDRPAGSYDLISLSSVLEFVPDDRRAFSELLRIGSPGCIVHCTFTPAATDAPTHHYDRPHGTFGRRHLYGTDLTEWFETAARGLTAVVTVAVDPVTGVEETVHFFCREPGDAEVLSASLASGSPPFEVRVAPPSPAPAGQ
jgi:hypothetical protein